MADRDWLYRESAPLLVAAKAAGVSGAQANQINGLAWVTAKHKTLMRLDSTAGRGEFDQLDRKTQDMLRQMFPDAQYSKDEGNFLDKTFSAVGNVFTTASDKMEGYSDFLGRFWRTAATANDVGDWSDAWNQAADGKRMFDQDREDLLRKTYDAATFKIAKRMISGDAVGEILADLTTNEEFAAMEKMLSGDENSLNALRDFDNAHISFGRSLAHVFGLDPDVGKTDQGLEAKVFSAVSGAADLVYDVALDPTTWLFGGISAYRKASLGVMQLMKAEAGAPTLAQKAFGKVAGEAFTWDRAFTQPRVRQMWDDIGANVKTAAESKNRQAGAVARLRVSELVPSLDPAAIETLIQHRVFDADTALKFMKDQETVSKVLVGKSGSMTRMLPTHSRTNRLRKNLEAAVHDVTGYSKNTQALETGLFKDPESLKLLAGQSAAASAEVAKVRQFSRSAGRMLERAFVEKSIYTAGSEPGSGRSLRALSSGSIYTLARLVFDKPTSKALQYAFVSSKNEAEARQLVKGLYHTIADASGANATDFGRAHVNDVLSRWDQAVYGIKGYVSDATAAAGGMKGGLYDHTVADGASSGTALYHIKHQMLMPNVSDLLRKVGPEGTYAARVLGLKGANQAATDFWSALNLLPRLGIRSVMDEGLFHALTMPTYVLANSLRGWQAGQVKRLTGSIDSSKDVGFVVRHVLGRVMTKDLTPEKVKAALQAGPEASAALFEEQMTKSLLGRATFAGKNGALNAKYVADMVKYGSYEQTRGLSEGLSAAISGGDTAMGNGIGSIVDIANPSLLADMKRHRIVLGGKPTSIPRGDSAFHANTNIQLLNVVDRNDEIGKIAVAYMENPQEAVDRLVRYFRTPEGRSVYRSFDRHKMKTKDMRTNAYDMYIHVRQQFTNDADEINQGILDIVRPNGYGVTDGLTATNVTIDNIIENSHLFRSSVFGYSKETTYMRSFPTLIDNLINEGFVVMDRQIGTMARDPAVLAYAMKFRRELQPVEEKFAQTLMKQGFTAEHAAEEAARKYSNLATELSINRVIGFVDNPNVRSNAAFAARNIARYYRANEDFYRRTLRVLREDGPQAFVRLRMANEGLSHTGFIHEDDQGDKYFTVPVDEIMYSAYAGIMNVLGVEVKRPIPLQLTGKIKMMTPSLDPESNLPTFAGPLMSLSWAALKNVGLIPEEYRASVTRGLFGQYAEGQSWFEQLVPSTLKRSWIAGGAVLGIDNDQVASATMKSMAMYAANGMAPDSKSTMAERDEFKREVNATARNIVFMRNVLGLISPVAPQLSEIADIKQELLQAGVKPFKNEFQSMVQAEYNKGNPDAWNTAIVKWTKVNKGRLVYTVSEAEANTVGTIRKTGQAVQWIQQNRDLADKYREAAVFLMPQANNFDMDAYAFLKREGFIKRKDTDQYFEEIANVVAENHYYDVKNKYEKQIESAPPFAASEIRSQMDAELASFKKANPYLARMFEQRDGTTQLKRDVVQNMSDALDSGLVADSDTARRIRKMVNAYRAASAEVDGIGSNTDAASAARSNVKSEAQQRLQTMAGMNPNAVLFYETILKRLLD